MATFRRHILATSRTQISNLICVFSMELGNHIDETTSGKSPSESRVGVVADARHCGVSSMRAQAKIQIAQFLPNPGRRILGGAIRNVGNICLRIGSVRTPMMFVRPWLKYLHVAIHRFRAQANVDAVGNVRHIGPQPIGFGFM